MNGKNGRATPVLMVVACLLAGATGRAEAGFLNHSIHSQYYVYNLSTLFDDEGIKAVSPSATFTAYETLSAGSTPFLQATFTDTNLTITSVFPYGSQDFFATPFDGFSFTDTGGNLGVSSFKLDAATNVAGFSASDVTLSGRQLLVNFSGLLFPTSGVISLDFSPATVPEPSSLALWGIAGAIGLALARVRCKRA